MIRFYPNKFSKNSFILLVISAAIVLVILPLFQQGTFIDGMLYKTVAFNYSQHLSTFWTMKFTEISMSYFCEQPPLYFYLLGNFYKLFNNYFLIDRVFTFSLFIGFIFLLNKICKLLFKHPNPFFLVFIFLFLSIPVFCWTYVNQVIEPLLNVFVISSIYFFIKFKENRKFSYAIFFGINCVLLFLTKGFQSCFIIGIPFFYFLFSKFDKKYFTFFSIALVVLSASLFVGFKFNSEVQNWFDCYFNRRLLQTFKNVGNTTTNHFEIISRFFTEQLILILFLFALLFYFKLKKGYLIRYAIKNFISNSLAVSLLLTSLLGSFPFALSLVQRGFYLVPSFVCFVLALVIGFKRYWFILIYRFQLFELNLVYKLVCRIIFLVILIFSIFTCKNYKRDTTLLNDLKIIFPYLVQKQSIYVEEDLMNYYSLLSYLYIEKKINLTTDLKNKKYMLLHKSTIVKDTNIYKKINLKTEELNLYYIFTKINSENTNFQRE